jgi:hypothetical protein
LHCRADGRGRIVAGPHGRRESVRRRLKRDADESRRASFRGTLAGGWVSFVFGNIEPIEDVEFFKDRVTIARHRQDAQQFAGRPARARDFPSAYRVGAVTGRKAAQFRHVRRGQRSADRITEIHAELFQFGAGHWGRFKLASCAVREGSRGREFFITSRPATPPDVRLPASRPARNLDRPPPWCG